MGSLLFGTGSWRNGTEQSNEQAAKLIKKPAAPQGMKIVRALTAVLTRIFLHRFASCPKVSFFPREREGRPDL
jgi:hypothetical protein